MQLLLLDTVAIQPYIFGSNRLSENIGASHLVALATGDWVRQALPSPHNLDAAGEIDPDRCIENDDTLRAELVYAGGGNAVVLLRDAEEARKLARQLSRRALCEAPGLQLVLLQAEFVWGDDNKLAGALKTAFGELARLKSGRSFSIPPLGVGATRPCRSTGLAATGYAPRTGESGGGYPASAEILAKLAAADAAEARLRATLPLPATEGARARRYPRDFDSLGRTEGEHSYIAVVHADGDGLGQRLQDLLAAAPSNRAAIQEVRKFSQAVDCAATAALGEALQVLCGAIEEDGRGRGFIGHAVAKALAEQSGDYGLLRDSLSVAVNKQHVPFRPLVFGGDDVTWVCDGRLGLSLAASYLRAFEAYGASIPGHGRATACAGVAIVKSHYPFAQAYALASDLCTHAKQHRRTLGQEVCALDWHLAPEQISGGIEAIREREFRVPLNGQSHRGQLELRPLSLEPVVGSAERSWQAVERVILEFQLGRDWATRRNKIKALRDALRDGPNAVEQFRHAFRLGALPTLQESQPSFQSTGWNGTLCGYFDAVEALDWHLPLEVLPSSLPASLAAALPVPSSSPAGPDQVLAGAGVQP